MHVGSGRISGQRDNATFRSLGKVGNTTCDRNGILRYRSRASLHVQFARHEILRIRVSRLGLIVVGDLCCVRVHRQDTGRIYGAADPVFCSAGIKGTRQCFHVKGLSGVQNTLMIKLVFQIKDFLAYLFVRIKIQRGQPVFSAGQDFQFGVLPQIQQSQTVVIAGQIFQFGVIAHIQYSEKV